MLNAAIGIATNMKFFLIIFILFLYNKLSNQSEICEARQIISAAMIGDKHQPQNDLNSFRIWDHIMRFNHIFENVTGGPAEMRFWPTVWSLPCFGDSRVFDKGRGSNLAHKEIWDNFYRFRRPCGIEQHDMLMIFEYDAFLGFPGAEEVAIELLHNTTADVYFLGYCYKKRDGVPWGATGRAPWCLHAYAISVKGAKQLLEEVDACGMFADARVANLADAKQINWDLARQDYDHLYIDETFNRDGIHLSGSFLYRGLFVQAKFDPDVSHLPEGTVAHRKHSKELFYKQNHTWHAVRDMDEFNQLGLSGSNIIQLSDWQLKQNTTV